jgi:Prokaryotic RING finger family 1
MTSVVVDAADAGRSCPYCRFPLKAGTEAERCEQCGALHHDECWRDGGGCAILGCSNAGALAREGPEPTVAPATLPPTEPPRRSRIVWLVAAAAFLAAAGVAAGAYLLTNDAAGEPEVVTVTAAQVETETTTVAEPAPPPAEPPVESRETGRVPAVYTGRFTSVDRLQRCRVTNASVVCTSGPSGDGARLEAGGQARRLESIGSSDAGGPAMPMGTAFRTPDGTLRCESSRRGITCKDLTGSGGSFTIGDYRVVIGGESPPPPSSSSSGSTYTGYFTSVDRLQRCYVVDDYAECSAGPSGKQVRLDVGSGARYLGRGSSRDNGGIAMRIGSSFTTPGETIRCSSSRRGIECEDVATGDGFVIGDYRVVTIENGRERSH